MQIGIGVNQHNVDPTIGNQFPARWDVLNSGTFAGVVKPKIELWPTPDAIYNMKLEYNAALGEFTEDTDTTTIPAQLILLHAIVTMKSHYQQTDFQLYVGQLEQLLGRLKTIGLQAGGSTRRYFKRSQAFSLDPESTWPMASNVTQQVINIASTIISTTDATLIEAADSP